MNSVSIVFPHQLFENHPALDKSRPVYLVEEYLFFKQYKFHKQKLVFHRASLKFYEDYLLKNHYKVTYIESSNDLSDVRRLIPYFKKKKVQEIHFADLVDNWLEKRIIKTSTADGISFKQYNSLGFINTKEDNVEYFKGKKKFSQSDFYIKQRKKLGLLLTENGNPVGGKWSFDAENRLKYPAKKTPPKINFPQPNEYVTEAIEYVEKNFTKNYGQTDKLFNYPVTFSECKNWLNQFLKRRFEEFGPYEDAIVADEHILNHSLLSPLLNSGLLSPEYVVQTTVKFAQKNDIPINSLEGFIRQIIGWREFIRGIYEIAGTKQRTKNFWKFKRKIPKSFWQGKTGIDPLDITINKILSTGYCHHIERLMVIGNFMLLCEFDPDDVYKWFMELFIDAYDWVMVPNVYGMSQFSDGGIMATKPYISGNNYLKKMSNYKKGNWQSVWDGLFWRFMDKHRNFFQQNPRLGMLLRTFDKMPKDKRLEHISNAENYLKEL